MQLTSQRKRRWNSQVEFLIDMPLSPALALWLRDQGHDAIHASEADLSRSSDVIILERARSEKRVVITADLDYPRLLALLGAEGPGLILFRGGEYSEAEVVDRLKEALTKIFKESAVGGQVLKYQFVYQPLKLMILLIVV